MQNLVRGVLGIGVTLGILAAGMMTVNGIGRGWAGKQLAKNPDDANAQAVLMLL